MSDLWSAITLVLIALLGGIVRVSTPSIARHWPKAVGSHQQRCDGKRTI
jgi:hypothetical protein